MTATREPAGTRAALVTAPTPVSTGAPERRQRFERHIVWHRNRALFSDDD
jgi:hypothetical protein